VLEPLSTVTLDDPDPGDRASIHFACALGSTLYTIRKDTTLHTWHLDAALVPTPCGSTMFPNGSSFYAPLHHFEADRLVLRAKSRLAVIDVREPARPAPLVALEVEHLVGCVAVGDRLHVQLRFADGRYGYARGPFPPVQPFVLHDQTPELEASTAAAALAVAGRIYWVTQDGIESRTIEPDREVGRLTLDNVVGYPIQVGENRIAVLEIYDDARSGVVFCEVAARKPKRLAVLCKKELVRGWTLVGNELYVALRSRANAVTTIATIDVTSMTETRRETLSYVESSAAEWVTWLGVAGETVAVLRGNGELHRFRW
jgi:hypothetical protein